MGALMRSLDWSRTPIGPTEEWPSALKTAVSICLNSRFPMYVWWGPELVCLYNDPYRPVLGNKHPASMGAPGREVWSELWDVIGPMLEGVMSSGEATWSDDQLLLMNRSGYLEATYFTFSYSPIRDDSGAVAGVFTAVTETTEQVLSTRRLRAVSRLAERTAEARTRGEVARAAVAALGEAAEDVPFALLYLLEGDGARLTGARGLAAGGPLAPEHAALEGGADPWQLAGVLHDPMGRQFDGLGLTTTDDAHVDSAVALPIARLGSEDPAGVLVLGANPRRALNADYRNFFRLLVRQIATALSSVEGLEAERARADALVALDRAKTDFFSNVSHEFRTPLTLMLGPLADALADDRPTLAGQADRIDLAHRSALRLLRLVNALLDFSRMEAGRAAASFMPVDLARVAAETAAVFRAAAERSGLDLAVDVPAELWLEADPEMLEKILLNLLSNAYKFTFQGRIELRIRLDERAVIEVTDTGVGIPPEEIPHLFERFRRIEGTHGRSHEGTGIGLALVHELVALHGGKLSASSTVGAGTTFTVELPLHQEGAGEARPTQPWLEALREGFGQEALRWEGDELIERRPTGESEAHVLVVDDNADLREYLSRLLSSRYAVRTAADGAEALERLAEKPADLVLTDVMMPRLDGLGLLAELRRNARTRRLPVIMLSARADGEASVEALDAGADDYLIKPFSAAELMARVRANLEVTRLRDALAAGERSHARAMEDVALTLQRSLLPAVLPDVLGTDMWGRYVPAGHALEIGGDFYDATPLPDGRVVVTIGDVAGHGVLAAAVMGQVRQALRAYALEGHPPDTLMDRLDRLVHDGDLVMTTCLCGILDPATGVLRFSNAGHLPPLIRRRDGSIERLTGGLSNPLGASATPRHVEAEAQLEVGDTLLLYTDGLVERRGESIDLGIDRLAATWTGHGAEARELGDRLVAGLDDRGPEDDVALLVVQRTGVAGEALRTVLPAHPSRLVDVRRRLVAWLAGHGAAEMEINDIVLATHEACMNAVEHAYGPADAEITVTARMHAGSVEIEVTDEGNWRESRSEHRGRGQAIMSSLMDEVETDTGPAGSVVRLRRRLGSST
jgi:signal transduction histidine kinase/serine phosphatase RsbU (regulator of sigma subunit)